MSIHIYLDHNIVDDISKGDLSLKPSNKVVWVYSNEGFAEIRRSGSTRFLKVLENLRAVKLDLILDSNFNITGEARFLEYRPPSEEYESYLEANSNPALDNRSDLEFMARLFGAHNKDMVTSHPNSFEENIRSLLEPHGLYDEEIKLEVERIRRELEDFVAGPLHEIGGLEETRKAFGTHKGRASNLASKENPLNELWEIVGKGISGVTADQYFGFDPPDKHGYEKWPMFLGIVGCHTMLNVLGFKPDDGLTVPRDIPGILSDGSHIAYAAYCQGFLSRDQKLLAKARAIYRYKSIGTQLLTVEY